MHRNEQSECSSRPCVRKKDGRKSKGVDSCGGRLPTLTGDSNTDWCLWQLTQVLLDIAKSIKKDVEKTTDGDD